MQTSLPLSSSFSSNNKTVVLYSFYLPHTSNIKFIFKISLNDAHLTQSGSKKKKKNTDTENTILFHSQYFNTLSAKSKNKSLAQK